MNKFRDLIIDHTLDEFEGGVADHKKDRGGFTNYGITKPFYAQFTGIPVKKVTDADIKALRRERAFELYCKAWDSYKIERLPQSIQHVYFDMCINHGPGNAAKILQRAINCNKSTKVTVDGKVGPATLRAAEAGVLGSPHLIAWITLKRQEFYDLIVKNDPSQIVFLKGWTNRNRWFDTNRLTLPVEVEDNKEPAQKSFWQFLKSLFH